MRVLRTTALVAAMACCSAFAMPSHTVSIPNAMAEQAEERELVVSFSDAILALQSDGKPSVLHVLQARHPELRHTGVDRHGLHRFLVSPEHAPRIPEFRDSLTAMGGTVGKTMPSPRLQALYHSQMLALRMGEPDVLGLIVKYRDLAKRKAAAEAQPLAAPELGRLQAIAGRALAGSRPMFGEAYAVRFETATDFVSATLMAKRLATAPDIESVDVDTRATAFLTPNDELLPLQWSLTSSAGGIRAPQAWDITTGSSSVTIAVVDTGVLLTHPDLAGRLLPGIDTITNSAVSLDGGGRDTDPSDPGDFEPAGACGAGSPAQDSSWHGTHVAGTIGANTNNGMGAAGVDWRARILPVRTLGRCGADSVSDIVDAIAWAAGLAVPGLPANPNPARVINASLGGLGDCNEYHGVMQQALQRGALVVAAAGNNNANALNYRPASCALALTVSATGPTGEKASYSNFHQALEISAPGGDFGLRGEAVDGIVSTSDRGTQGPTEHAYKYEHGTSMAAPHVSGVLGLMLSVAPTLTVAQMRDTISKTARAYPAGSRCATQGDCGPGILDAQAAVTRARALNNVRTNYSALWFKPSEDGWGVNLQQQGDILFGTWFTYRADNTPMWYVMPAMQRVGDEVFTGEIYELTGVPFRDINGQLARRTIRPVGAARVYFFNDNKAFFEVAMEGGIQFLKQINPQIFGTARTCAFTTASRTAATNFSDLWYNANESGWGINLDQQGDLIFATWFTYDNSGNPVWLVADGLRRTSGNTFTGDLYVISGKPTHTVNGTSSSIGAAVVGSMTVSFQNGERGTLTYTVQGTTQSKVIERQVWSTPLSSCR